MDLHADNAGYDNIFQFDGHGKNKIETTSSKDYKVNANLLLSNQQNKC